MRIRRRRIACKFQGGKITIINGYNTHSATHFQKSAQQRDAIRNAVVYRTASATQHARDFHQLHPSRNVTVFDSRQQHAPQAASAERTRDHARFSCA